MQPIPGMTRVGGSANEGQVRQAAQLAQQQRTQAVQLGRFIAQEIDAWQKDKDASHLLRAIDGLRGMCQVSAGIAQQAAGAANSAAGASAGPKVASWSPPSPPGAYGGRASGGVSPGASPGVTVEDVRQVAENIKNNVNQAASAVRAAAESTVRSLLDTAEALVAAERGAREEGLHGGLLDPTRLPGKSGFGGRAGGAIGGFGGRASGNIPQR